MSFAVIPCTPNDSAWWRQRTVLAGREYTLEFLWNQRDGKWRLSIADQDGVALRTGIVLVSLTPLLLSVQDARRPPGELVVVDMRALNGSTAPEDPAFDDLGTRFLLTYVEPDA